MLLIKKSENQPCFFNLFDAPYLIAQVTKCPWSRGCQEKEKGNLGSSLRTRFFVILLCFSSSFFCKIYLICRLLLVNLWETAFPLQPFLSLELFEINKNLKVFSQKLLSRMRSPNTTNKFNLYCTGPQFTRCFFASTNDGVWCVMPRFQEIG